MSNTILGRYIDKNSWVHRLDPRIKLIGNIVLLVLLFLIHNLIFLGIFNFLIIILYLAIGLGWKYPFKLLLKLALPVGIIVFIINAWMMPIEGEIFFESPHFKIAQSTFVVTGRVIFRVEAMMVVVGIFTATTKPLDTTNAIEDLLWPLKLVKIPVQIIAMVITIALQFLPNMIDHAKKITEAQASRGMDMRHSNYLGKLKGVKAIWIPLLASAFNNAIALGEAMDARGYSPHEKRLRYKQYKINWIDLATLLFLICLLAAAIILKYVWIELPSWWW